MEDVKRSLRFPVALYKRLQEIAEREHRSVAAQVVMMLEEAVGRYDRERKKGKEEGNSLPALLGAVRPANSAGV